MLGTHPVKFLLAKPKTKIAYEQQQQIKRHNHCNGECIKTTGKNTLSFLGSVVGRL